MPYSQCIGRTFLRPRDLDHSQAIMFLLHWAELMYSSMNMFFVYLNEIVYKLHSCAGFMTDPYLQKSPR